MSFYNEIASALGDNIRAAGGYNIINFNGESVYIEGIRRIVSIDAECIVMTLSRDVLTVEGENLDIFELEKETVIVKGGIKAVRVGKD